ncbi:MAG: dihydropteroate synthase [Alphaproteobacteria bacterium]|nr:dihydropteroate synthase [Alphaproteobacteria bacterium]
MTLPVRWLTECTGLEISSGPVYLRPSGLAQGAEAQTLIAIGCALPLAGGPVAFQAVDVVVRGADGIRIARLSVDAAAGLSIPDFETRLARLTAPRAPVAGLSLDRARVMGIVNVTPDSFSDGGDHADPAAAIAHGRALVDAGADLLDIGGESTRPGSDPVPIGSEVRRTIPVLSGLVGLAPLSIDTRNAAVMTAALDAGAALVNDVSALRHDPQSLPLVAERGASVALMHMLADPKTMQIDPRYDHAPLDVYDMLEARIAACEAAGLPRDRLLVDPGFGFGKTADHNMAVTDWLTLFHGLGCPVLFGASRKSTIGAVSSGEPAKERLPGSIALALAAVARGAQMVRVHDVAETVQALAVQRALHGA